MIALENGFVSQDVELWKCCAELIRAKEEALIAWMADLPLSLGECFVGEKTAGGERGFDGGEEGSLEETDDDDEVGILIVDGVRLLQVTLNRSNRYAVAQGQSARAREGIWQDIDGDDIESLEREVNGVPPCATGEIQCHGFRLTLLAPTDRSEDLDGLLDHASRLPEALLRRWACFRSEVLAPGFHWMMSDHLAACLLEAQENRRHALGRLTDDHQGARPRWKHVRILD